MNKEMDTRMTVFTHCIKTLKWNLRQIQLIKCGLRQIDRQIVRNEHLKGCSLMFLTSWLLKKLALSSCKILWAGWSNYGFAWSANFLVLNNNNNSVYFFSSASVAKPFGIETVKVKNSLWITKCQMLTCKNLLLWV